MDAAVRGGLYAAGFISYEAAPGLDPALVTRRPGPLPLLWFGLYDRMPTVARGVPPPPSSLPPLAWTPSVSVPEYRRAVGRIKDLIAAGDTYQVNYTLRQFAPFAASPWLLFLHLIQAQKVRHAAFLDLGDHALCSVSPELFFRLDGGTITCRPMKGTAPRGLSAADDAAQADALCRSQKDRAENIMIVDMMRNDLGRIARTGSVTVPHLFEVERYRTLFQMTSTVQARTSATTGGVLRALFPPASVTGAPKVRTMQIIAELETEPRGVYTGAMGYAAPGGKAQFNVAIRTVHIDKCAGRAAYGVGGGIVWDSVAEKEYEECRTKALVVTTPPSPCFHLLETMLWRPRQGYLFLKEHLDRLSESARYFGFAVDIHHLARRLVRAGARLGDRPHRLRVLASEDGACRIEIEPAPMGARRVPWNVALAARPIDPANPFLYHKTTNRAVYEQARAQCPGRDDVILWNEKEQVTESTVANIVVRIRGRLLTPPVECGLLPGVHRARLLRNGTVREAVVTIADLARAEAVYLVNSVRGWMPCRLDSRRRGGYYVGG